MAVTGYVLKHVMQIASLGTVVMQKILNKEVHVCCVTETTYPLVQLSPQKLKTVILDE